jgi:thiosulfate/3-mercaptopyruvate sulfurtransferase
MTGALARADAVRAFTGFWLDTGGQTVNFRSQKIFSHPNHMERPTMFRTLVAAALLALAVHSPALADWKKLQTPEEVAALNPAEVLILDIRGSTVYSGGHVPGAVNAPYPLWRGPAKNPGRRLSDEDLTELLRSIGAAKDKPTVVTYGGKDETDFGAAARVYWTLKSAGIEQIAILNGGLRAWGDANLDVSRAAVQPEPSDIEASLSDRWMLTREGVQDVVEGRSKARLVDARPLEFFEGRRKHQAAKRAGTLKGAMSLVHSSWFAPDRFKLIATPAAAEQIARKAGYEASKNDAEVLVSFCNTGHWAATNWFALSEVAGIENVKLYPESMVGWSNAFLPMVNTD